MSFQSYIANVEASTGRSITELVAAAKAEDLADDKGLAPGVKAGQVLTWLKDQYGLGHGHGMAVVAYIKGKRT
ncbi:MAG: DUF4287 domain-containing protein [Bosea sp. (in: a-proteobacteria)]